MAADLKELQKNIVKQIGGKVVSVTNRLNELTLVIKATDLLEILTLLRDDSKYKFEQLIDLTGMDYSTYGSDICEDGVFMKSDSAEDKYTNRFAAVYHLLSITHNVRIRVRAFAEDDEFPVLDSVANIWSSANWYEREAFDLYGIVFTGHPDLRRILTDYGFIGNAFRKDFPLSGEVEMRYDAEQQRVIYQPVTVEPRENTPRIIREEHYGRS